MAYDRRLIAMRQFSKLAPLVHVDGAAMVIMCQYVFCKLQECIQLFRSGWVASVKINDVRKSVISLCVLWNDCLRLLGEDAIPQRDAREHMINISDAARRSLGMLEELYVYYKRCQTLSDCVSISEFTHNVIIGLSPLGQQLWKTRLRLARLEEERQTYLQAFAFFMEQLENYDDMQRLSDDVLQEIEVKDTEETDASTGVSLPSTEELEPHITQTRRRTSSRHKRRRSTFDATEASGN